MNRKSDEQRTPAQLREESRNLRDAARAETNLEIKRALAERALKLAQLAEKIEREGKR
ncbi:MAG TPA: hypothetical protein VMU06_12985 [Stellaceae bacterium]|nr:hypothetical protein [Stellaceae bacterium]